MRYTRILALALLLSSCGALPLKDKNGEETVVGKGARAVVSIVVGVVVATLGGGPVGGVAAGTGTSMALEPSHPKNITNVNVQPGGKFTLNQSAAHGFLGVSSLMWGIILGQLAQFLIRNRRYVMAFATGRVPKGQRLKTFWHMLVGGILDEARNLAPAQPPPPQS